ncbi:MULTISPECIES: hypothetical protein [Streptomyces]|uniref:hypothetical protein n=1 Tax=Streptomyces TaxID=1883 RepID=UPI001317C4C4|nr:MULTISPECIES: hypothetical protein [Streptomyces]QGZ51270.1 hypothetical protein GPZ77_25375 [Streptomyces sp. QHH-9511]GGU05185.1 hypothetical protein GCM10010272_57890 [Streptomyces lateritius]
MERITDEQISQLARFVVARIPDAVPLKGEARRAAVALRIAAYKQIAAVRYHRASSGAQVAETDLHAAASWNLLVAFADVWRDHPDFPADAAIETFEFDSESPLSPLDTHTADVAG